MRFAPSPTGYLHVGGARTALFNWLFARNQGGTFILRIEDTDVDRNRPELVDGILESLRWLGLDWDEGPFHQSERLAGYRAAAEKLAGQRRRLSLLLPAGKIRGRRRTREDETDEAPRGASAASRVAVAAKASPPPRTSGPRFVFACRSAKSRDSTTPSSARRKSPAKRSRISFSCARPKTDAPDSALPTYHLGAVVDDIEMRITHVIRGADHISNTPKQVLIYRALAAPLPIFAHVPLILGPDRTRLSKRHGATSVGSYREEGFLPEAFRNFLALLGWSPGDDSEFLRTPEIVARFSLAGVSRTNAVFDRAKLEWFDQQYLQKLPIDELLPAIEGELKRSGLWRDEWAGRRAGLVCAHRGSAAPAHPPAAGFLHLGARLFLRRFFLRSRRPREILERRAPARPARKPRRRARGLARMDARRLRSRPARNRRIGGRESRPADQRHPRGPGGPRRRPAACSTPCWCWAASA